MTASYKYTDQYTPEQWTLNVETPAYHPVEYRLLRTNRAAISFKIGVDNPSVTPEFTITAAAIGLEGHTRDSYADWVDGVYTSVPYDCGGGELSFGVTKWNDLPDWYGNCDDIASLPATGAGTASLPHELAESWVSVNGSSLFGNAENLLAIQFQDNTFDDAFYWNYIQGSLDPGSPYYDDTVAYGKARRAGQMVGPGWFQFNA